MVKGKKQKGVKIGSVGFGIGIGVIVVLHIWVTVSLTLKLLADGGDLGGFCMTFLLWGLVFFGGCLFALATLIMNIIALAMGAGENKGKAIVGLIISLLYLPFMTGSWILVNLLVDAA